MRSFKLIIILVQIVFNLRFLCVLMMLDIVNGTTSLVFFLWSGSNGKFNTSFYWLCLVLVVSSFKEVIIAYSQIDNPILILDHGFKQLLLMLWNFVYLAWDLPCWSNYSLDGQRKWGGQSIFLWCHSFFPWFWNH